MKSAEVRRPSIQTGLPLKIAGIVFWGLMAIGLVVAAGAMKWMEREFLDRYAFTAAQAISVIQIMLDANPEIPNEHFQAQIGSIAERLGIPAITVERGLDTLTVGAPEESYHNHSAVLSQRADQGSADTATPVLITVYDFPAAVLLKVQKKKLILAMGLIFFIFGLLLQWILQKVLTRPFLQMVSAAEQCSRGEAVLFDESRADEFGYLSSFINKALNALNERRMELSEALERAMVSEHALFEEKERAEVTLNSIAEGVITTDRNGNIRFMNPVAETLSGWSESQATGKHITEIFQLVDDATGDHMESSAIRCMDSRQVERSLNGCLLIRKDGEEIAVEESSAPMHDHYGNTIGAVLVFDDIRQKKKLTEQLSYQASHDPLTGLYNRIEFERRVRMALKNLSEEKGKSALCYMDLDQFKIVNDTCGHIAGDELLRQLGQLLHQTIRESDTIARLGGDEFGILLHDCSMEDAGHLAAGLRQKIHDFDFWWDGKSFNVGASIGLVPLTAITQNVTEALAAADVACYAAKENGRDQVHVYEPNDRELKRRRGEMQWVGRIRQALREDRFQLCLQPVVPVDRPDNLNSHGEILLRMLDEQGDTVPPGKFLGAAEQYGLMPMVDEWVLRNTLNWLAASVKSKNDGTLISVNLSGQSLSTRSFLTKVVDLLHDSGVSPEQICFEITETAAVANFEIALKFIRLLKGMGCKFAIDDFGNGVSSFAYLKQLPVNYLKIDGSYVRDMLRDPIDRALVEAVNQIGHSMGMKTIAEFVEDDATLHALALIGVDYAQGYGIGKPAPLEIDVTHGGMVIPHAKSYSAPG